VIGPDTAFAVCRFLHDASVMFVWGASAYLAVLVPPALAQNVGRRLRSTMTAAIAIAVAATIATLPIQVATIGEGWDDALDPVTVGSVLFATSIGTAWLFQTAAAVILLATLMVSGHGRSSVTAVAAALAAICITLIGHAVMQSGWLGVLHRLNDVVHVLAAGAWLGGLVPLFLILGMKQPEYRGEVDRALTSFSTVGQIVVGLVLLSGIANTALVLGTWPTDWSSPYQALLAAKIAAVGVMTGLALINRYIQLPEVDRDGSRALQQISMATVGEIGLGLTAIGLVSVFGILDPV
jgi:putative copper resistance protein D